MLMLINYNKSSCNRIEDQRSHQKDKLVLAANINRTSMKDNSLVYTIYLFFIYCFIYISPLYLKLFLFNLFSFYFTLLRTIYPLSGIEILDAYISTFRLVWKVIKFLSVVSSYWKGETKNK